VKSSLSTVVWGLRFELNDEKIESSEEEEK
jgi:hypothetical protein